MSLSAREGELGLIPGPIGTASYVGGNLGNAVALNSSPRGAGRGYSRSAALRFGVAAGFRRYAQSQHSATLARGLEGASEVVANSNRQMGGSVTFVSNAGAVARIAMGRIDPDLNADFEVVIEFLTSNPDAARTYPNLVTGSTEYIERLALLYSNARVPRVPHIPGTIPDPAVSVVLSSYYGVATGDLDRVKHEHLLSMGAENFVGNLLERYIASKISDAGWVWCAGEFVRSVDFVRPVAAGGWESLQVKNRDNSENSSSMRVRLGTSIAKWHRSASRTGQTNWANFPAPPGHTLSEEGFLEFIDEYFEMLL